MTHTVTWRTDSDLSGSSIWHSGVHTLRMWQESDDKIVIVDKQQFELTDYFMQKKKILVQRQRRRVDLVEERKVGIRVTLKSNIKAVWVRAAFTMDQSPGFQRPQKRQPFTLSPTARLELPLRLRFMSLEEVGGKDLKQSWKVQCVTFSLIYDFHFSKSWI